MQKIASLLYKMYTAFFTVNASFFFSSRDLISDRYHFYFLVTRNDPRETVDGEIARRNRALTRTSNTIALHGVTGKERAKTRNLC